MGEVERDDRMVRLRELILQTPTKAGFQRIAKMFEYWDDEDTLSVGLAYAESHLTEWPDDVRGSVKSELWPKCPHGTPAIAFGLVRELNLKHRKAGFAIEHFANSPHLSKITILNLAGSGIFRENMLNSDGAKALAQSPYLSELKSLDLSLNDIGDDGAKALAESPHFPNLVKLDLGGSGIELDGLKALAASPYLAKLHFLGYIPGLDQRGVAEAKVLGLSTHLSASARRPFLEHLLIGDLKQAASEREIKGRSKMGKEQLIEALLQ